MKKLWVFFLMTVIGAIFCLGVSLPAMAGNCGYVVNGNFNETNPVSLGFEFDTTYYNYLLYPSEVYVNSPKWLWEPGEMTIVDDPSNVHGGWSSFPNYDPQNPDNMLVVNGSQSATSHFWKQTFNLRPDTNYVFSFELANVAVWDEHTGTYQIAQINLNKTDSTGSFKILGPVSVPTEDVGIFHRFEVTINSGTTGTFDLFFTNDNTEASANDFAMDNICMTGLMVDIKPGSCPNAFNLKQKGLLPAAILGSENFDVTQLDMESVQLCLSDGDDKCIDPVKVELLDVGKPCLACEDCGCTSYSPTCDDEGICHYDYYLDLALKFNSIELAELLSDAEPGDEITMTIKADYYESDESAAQTLQGQDCIIIVNK